MSKLQLDQILNKEWLARLGPTIEKQKDVDRYLGVNREKTFPKRENTFAALNKMKPETVKVVVIGQDPYPREESAIGIAFHDGAIKKWTDPFSPSFRNIIKNVFVGKKLLPVNGKVDELRKLLASKKIVPPPEWFVSTEEQGCCWLNTSLTFTSTEQTDLKRHLGFWKPIVEAIFQCIIDAKKELLESKKVKKAGVVFLMWGAHAQKLRKSIEKMSGSSGVDVQFVEAKHPAVEQFHEKNSFELVNEALRNIGEDEIDFLGGDGANAKKRGAPTSSVGSDEFEDEKSDDEETKKASEPAPSKRAKKSD